MGYKGLTETLEFRQMRDAQEKESKIDVEPMKERIERAIGKHISEVEVGAMEAFAEQSDERDYPEVAGAREALGIDDAQAAKLLEEGTFLPKNFIRGEVAAVRFASRGHSMEHYGMAGTSVGSADELSNSIEIVAPPTLRDSGATSRDHIEAIRYIISHELAHANDWKTDRDLTIPERYELLDNVLTRLQSPDRVRGFEEEFWQEIEGDTTKNYVGSIQAENEQDEEYMKAKEYWGILVENYVTFPEWLQEEHPEDFALADRFLKKNDPSFDPVEARKRLVEYLETNFGPTKHKRSQAATL